MGFRPEEKGIKTSMGECNSHSPLQMGFRPEEKGIKTSVYGSYSPYPTDGIPT